MGKLEIPAGEWKVILLMMNGGEYAKASVQTDEEVMCIVKSKYVGKLIADAGNVYNETGFTPSELLDLYKAATEAVLTKEKKEQEAIKERDAEKAKVKQLREALGKLTFLHSCEQEGIGSGQPTPAEWFDAVSEANETLKQTK